MLRSIFERLDTTPGQEKAILAAAAELREPGERARDEIRQSMTEVAEALREDRIDEAKLRQAFSRQRDALGAAQETLLGALSRVHEALNPNQRRELAEWIQSRSRFYRHCDGDAIAA
jgi:Spy/CpxP family protein refolding chaperone